MQIVGVFTPSRDHMHITLLKEPYTRMKLIHDHRRVVGRDGFHVRDNMKALIFRTHFPLSQKFEVKTG